MCHHRRFSAAPHFTVETKVIAYISIKEALLAFHLACHTAAAPFVSAAVFASVIPNLK